MPLPRSERLQPKAPALRECPKHPPSADDWDPNLPAAQPCWGRRDGPHTRAEHSPKMNMKDNLAAGDPAPTGTRVGRPSPSCRDAPPARGAVVLGKPKFSELPQPPFHREPAPLIVKHVGVTHD